MLESEGFFFYYNLLNNKKYIKDASDKQETRKQSVERHQVWT